MIPTILRTTLRPESRPVRRGRRHLTPIGLAATGLAALLLVASVDSAEAQQTGLIPPSGEMVDGVAAVVGDSVVLFSQLMERERQLEAQGVQVPSAPAALAEFRAEILEGLINEQLILQAALQDTLLSVDEDQVEEAVQQDLDRRMQTFGGSAAMQSALEAEGLSMAAYRDILRAEFRRQQLQSQFLARQRQDLEDIEVSEEELRTFFEEQQAQIGERPATVTFRQVVLASEPSEETRDSIRALAAQLTERARAGEDFDSLAVEFSQDPGTAPAGGDLGWFRRGQFVEAFEDASFSLLEGQVSDPVETEFGFHVIKLNRIRFAERRAQHILLRPQRTADDLERTRELAEDIRTRLESGEAIEDLVEEYANTEAPDSLTVPTAQLGQALPPGYAGPMTGVETGDIVGPIQYDLAETPHFSIVEIVEAREAGAYAFEDLREQIRTRLAQDKQLERLLEDLRGRTYVEIRS